MAEELVGSDYVNMDRYLLDIARDPQVLGKQTCGHTPEGEKLEQTLADYEADADNLRMKRREILAEAKEEARKILEGSNAAIERTS